ncbi:unnamed protein product, partial [Discosporangium mesarthrocarpum]
VGTRSTPKNLPPELLCPPLDLPLSQKGLTNQVFKAPSLCSNNTLRNILPNQARAFVGHFGQFQIDLGPKFATMTTKLLKICVSCSRRVRDIVSITRSFFFFTHGYMCSDCRPIKGAPDLFLVLDKWRCAHFHLFSFSW